MTRRALSSGLIGLGCVAAAACSSEAIVLVPVIDVPDPSDNAAIGDLRQFVVSVAHAGDADDIVAQSFASGDTLALPDVPFGGDLVIHITGDKDVAYGRTCAFAINATDTPPSPHLFLSRLVKFATLPFVPEQRDGGYAVTYSDGSALMIGGLGAGGDVVDVERFDPITAESSVVASLLPRDGAVVAALGLASQQFAIIGGVQDSGAVSFFETVDVNAASSQRVESHQDPQMLMARIGLTATTLADGTIVVIGGRPPTGVATGLVAQVTPAPGGTPEVTPLPRAVLAHSRIDHTATRLGNDPGAKVLIAGGTDETGVPVAAAELFRPLTSDVADPATFAPAMVVPRSRHHAVLAPDGSVLIIGGVDAMGNPVRTIEQFSFDTGFVAVAELDAASGFVEFTTTNLPDGRILVVGGLADPANPASAVATAAIIEQHPVSGSITASAADTLAIARAGHQATLLCDGTVLVTGGTHAASPAERYNPIPDGRR